MKWQKKKFFYESVAGYRIAFLNDNHWHVWRPGTFQNIGRSMSKLAARTLAEEDAIPKEQYVELTVEIFGGAK